MRFNQIVWFFFGALAAQEPPLSLFDKKAKLENTQPKAPQSEEARFYGNPPDLYSEAFRIYAIGDYLYWQATESNLEYAMKQKNGSLRAVAEIDYPFKSAFRLGGGVVFPSYYWQLEVNWTHFLERFQDSQMQILGGNPALIGLWMRPLNQTLTTWERGSFFWNLKFDTFDFDLLREGFTNRNFSFAPRIGLKRAWIEQSTHVRYTTAHDFYDIRYRNDLRGLGIRIGFDTKIHGGWGFALAASGSTALLYGSFHLHRVDVSSFAGDSGVNLNEDIHRFSPMMQGNLSLEWSRSLSSWKCRISLALGCEGQIWFNQNQIRTFVSSSLPSSTFKANGDLTLQGLTCHARFDF